MLLVQFNLLCQFQVEQRLTDQNDTHQTFIADLMWQIAMNKL